MPGSVRSDEVQPSHPQRRERRAIESWIVLAVGLGALSGATSLVLDESIGMPWVQTWRLAGAAVVGGLLVAAICTIASAPRLRPESSAPSDPLTSSQRPRPSRPRPLPASTRTEGPIAG
jgi:hypothetical protein